MTNTIDLNWIGHKLVELVEAVGGNTAKLDLLASRMSAVEQQLGAVQHNQSALFDYVTAMEARLIRRIERIEHAGPFRVEP